MVWAPLLWRRALLWSEDAPELGAITTPSQRARDDLAKALMDARLVGRRQSGASSPLPLTFHVHLGNPPRR